MEELYDLEDVASALGKRKHILAKEIDDLLQTVNVNPEPLRKLRDGKVKWYVPQSVLDRILNRNNTRDLHVQIDTLIAEKTVLTQELEKARAELAQYRAGTLGMVELTAPAIQVQALPVIPAPSPATRQTAQLPVPVQAPAPTQTQGFTQEQFRSTMFDRNSDLCYKVNDLFNFAHEVLGLYLTCKADNLAYYTTSDLGTTALNMCGMAFSNIDFIDYKHTQDALSIVESIKELGRKGAGLQKPLALSEDQESLFAELKQKLRYEPTGFNDALFELQQPELCEEDEPTPVKQSGMESHPLFDGTFPVPHNLSEVDKMPYRSAFVSKAVELNDLEDLFDKCKRAYESVAKTAVRWAKPDAEGFVSDVNLFTTLDRRRWTKFKVESNDPELVTTEQKAQLEGHIKLLLNDIRSRLQWAKTNCKDGVQFEVSPTVEEAMPIYLDGKPREITYYGDDIIV